MLQAAIEAGGTKFIVAVGRFGEVPIREERIPTTDPYTTLNRCLDFFNKCRADGLDFDALGIGSFGPIDLNRNSPTWGFITETPKPGWAYTDVAGYLGQKLGVPTAFDTDVNTAALAEATLGSGKGLETVLYFTIGTGIGGGAVVGGTMLHGLNHPEMGHTYLKRHPQDVYEGNCPFHGDCAEGLASGPAIEKRWQCRGEDLPFDHRAWDMEAWYVAQMVVNAQMVFSAQAIILGGGVMDVPMIREKVGGYAAELAGKYLVKPRQPQEWNELIRAPGIEKPGLQGALIMAKNLIEKDVSARYKSRG